MAIWAIADIHASPTDPATGLLTKPMDVFGDRWNDHLNRLERAWKEVVQPSDTVVVAGDIDWSLHLEDAMETLALLDSWPGQKLLIRGNHDYWWSSKTTNRVRRALPSSIRLIHNNAVQVEGFNISGSKGSPVPGGMDWTAENAKLLNREVQRLEMSINARDPALPTIVALHFPPFYPPRESPFREVLERVEVKACVFGHLHGQAAESAPQGQTGNVTYALVAADAVGFRPVRVAEAGQLTLPTVNDGVRRDNGAEREPQGGPVD